MPAPSETIIELPVRGMTCAHCVATVQNALERTVGVLAAKVALKPGRASVTFDPTATDRSALQRAITAAGYSVPNDSETTAETQVQIHAIGPLLAPTPPVSGTSEDWNHAVGGMHCASCVARVEDALSRVPGVRSARVNLATERATVTLDPRRVSETSLAAAAMSAGYSVRRAELTAGSGAESLRRERNLHLVFWKTRLIEGLLLTAPMVVLGYAPIHLAISPGWIMFPLATILLIDLGLPYFRGAWSRLGQGSTNMDTLISLGTITAYSYSLVHLLRESPPHASFLPGVVGSAVYGLVVLGVVRRTMTPRV